MVRMVHLRRRLIAGAALLSFALLADVAPAVAQAQADAGGSSALATFRSPDELSAYLRDLADHRARRLATLARRRASEAPWVPVLACPTSTGAVIARRRAADSAPEAPQPAVVHGRVVDADGTPLRGANVVLAPTGGATTSDAGGAFALSVPAAQLVSGTPLRLRVRLVGFGPAAPELTASAGDSIELNVVLCRQHVQLNEVVVTGVAEATSVTNVQHAGVDEGGIVKLHGDHLVVLRRGRLFTVAVGDRHLRPVSTVDAYGPGMDAAGWYDEMLVSGDRVVVIGYSYARSATEINLFRLDGAGRLRYEATYHLRSNDYYSSRNYASRLVGTRLVFYTPLPLPTEPESTVAVMPALRRWRGDGEAGFRPIMTPRQVYRPVAQVDPVEWATLHTVTVCDLAARDLDCRATGVVASPGRVFYVSPRAVYVWASDWYEGGAGPERTATVYRMPLDGAAPTALGAAGSPVDQFSLLESDDGHLNVALRAAAHGDMMWGGERSGGPLSLLRVPIASFGDGSRIAQQQHYRRLPTPYGPTFQNRFVGAHLLYGTGHGWGNGAAFDSLLYVVPIRGGAISALSLGHGADRIEVMGDDAVVVGAGERDLHFTGIRLGMQPAIGARYALAEASQGELRSHGFFYRADGAESGVIGLPVRGPAQPGWRHLVDESAFVFFLGRRRDRFEELGTLAAGQVAFEDDACVASCVDWYGNARPLFVRGRVFALLGYELVEGREHDGRIVEVRRVSFAPRGRRVQHSQEH